MAKETLKEEAERIKAETAENEEIEREERRNAHWRPEEEL